MVLANGPLASAARLALWTTWESEVVQGDDGGLRRRGLYVIIRASGAVPLLAVS